MLSSVDVDVAMVIGASAALVVALALLLLVWRRGFQSVDVRVGAMHASVKAIEREVKPNGGSSLRDAVDRIAVTVDGHGEQLGGLTTQAARQCEQTDELTAQIKLHRARLDAIEDAVTTPTRKRDA